MPKVIVITGAGDGLGRAVARRFARDGETLVLLGRTLSKVQAVADELGGATMAVQCDVASADSVRTAFAAIRERHSAIDVLINNAGIFEPFTLAEAHDEKIVGTLMTNLAGPIFCAREALPLLGRGGHIINVSSESVQVRFPMLWMYESTKAALDHFSDAMARELSSAGIRVTTLRAGQMMDETKTGSSWEPDVSRRFGEACARAGLDLRERGISHYNSAADLFRTVVDMPEDINIGTVALSARPR
jgi:meso-butanediol dehydrogenase / (S,S)-butanediol dehydrogenase / diacetyl reductase